MRYQITITKYGSMEVEASSEDEAYEIAQDMEGEGSFFMNVEINVEKVDEES